MENKKITASTKVDRKFLDLLKTFDLFQETPHKNEVILEIKNLTKKFYVFPRKYVNALNGINLKIYKEDKIALLGANGAGKTTLLEIICGVNKQSNGTINYNYDYLETPYEKIGIQFQDASCPAGLTVYDLINIQNYVISKPLTDNEIVKFVEYFTLDKILTQKANRLSGGQQQILNIALAFMSNPNIILLDELSTALDVDKQFYVNKIVRDYINYNKSTLILSSHNIKEILFHTNRTIIIKKGKIVADAPNSAIIEHFKDFDFFLSNFLKYDA